MQYLHLVSKLLYNFGQLTVYSVIPQLSGSWPETVMCKHESPGKLHPPPPPQGGEGCVRHIFYFIFGCTNGGAVWAGGVELTSTEFGSKVRAHCEAYTGSPSFPTSQLR